MVADQVFERLMRGLEERGRYDDTLTIWAPDHGNGAGEPPRPTLGARMLYQHDVHVPLILLHPGTFSGERSRRLAGQLDLSPTLTTAMGAPPDPRDRGRNLLAPKFDPRRIYLLKTRGNAPFVGVVDGRYKLIFDIGQDRTELYDLSVDPEEHENIADQHPERARAYARDGVRLRRAQRQTLLSVPPLADEAKSVLTRVRLRCANGDGSQCADAVTTEMARCKGDWTTVDCLSIRLGADAEVELDFPGELVGRYDSLRVCWPPKERSKRDQVSLALQYGDQRIQEYPSRSRTCRLLPVPHAPAPTRPPVTVLIGSPSAQRVYVEFAQH